MDQADSDNNYGSTIMIAKIENPAKLSSNLVEQAVKTADAMETGDYGATADSERSASPFEVSSNSTTRPRRTAIQATDFAIDVNAGISACAFERTYDQSYTSMDVQNSVVQSSCASEPVTPCQPPATEDTDVLMTSRSPKRKPMPLPLTSPSESVDASQLQSSCLPTTTHSSLAVDQEDSGINVRHRRTRSASLPPLIPQLAELPIAESSSTRSALSHHQLITLHQLNLPRPPMLAQTYNRNPAHCRALSRFAQSAVLQATSLSVPKLMPPITRSTLRELDLREILRNPQLRHDIVFDPNLVFRPNFDGDRGSRKVKNSERYWAAVEREIATGCRCTAFGAHGQILDCICTKAESKSGRSRRSSDRSQPISLAQRLPSRIPGLVTELRNILLSLLPSSVDDGAASADYDVELQHAFIANTLDPELISHQIAHGAFDLCELAQFLGEVLKMHCAPMRDDLVDGMVAALEAGSRDANMIGQGLRLTFDIVEMMKLDIANHQLRTLRPYLLETAIEFEMRGCQEYLERRKATAFQKCQAWISSQSSKIASIAAQSAFIELVFHPDGRDYAALEGRVHTSRRFAAAQSPSSANTPESLQLDLYRIQSIHSHSVDLTIVYVLLMLFQQVVSRTRRATTEQVEEMRVEIWSIMQTSGLARSPAFTEPSQLQSQPSTNLGWKKIECPIWRDGMREVLLQMAARVKAIELGQSSPEVCPDEETVDLMEAWMESNLHFHSALFSLFHSRLQTTVDSIISSTLGRTHVSDRQRLWWLQACASTDIPVNAAACSRSARLPDIYRGGSGNWTLPKRGREDDDALETQPRKKVKTMWTLDATSGEQSPAVAEMMATNGLIPLQAEILSLSDKISKLLSFHLAIYENLYTQILMTE